MRILHGLPLFGTVWHRRPTDMIVRIALAQLNLTVGDINGNVARIIDAIEQARAAGADVVVTPEMAVSGYPPEDLLFRPSFVRACRLGLDRIAKACEDVTAIVGCPEHDDDLYNAAFVIVDGAIAGSHHKHYLPNYGVFDEDRYFAPGTQLSVFTCDTWTFGIGVCEDIWYPAGPQEGQATLGDAELLINISASPYHQGKQQFRERMLAARATDNAALLAFCNLVGGQDELVFDGASVVFGPTGALLARGPQFEEDLLVVDLDMEEVHRQRLRDPRRRKARARRSGDGSAPRRIPFATPKTAAKTPLPERPRRELLDPVAEVYRALVLGTGDYIRKNGFQTVVLGLSGGIDSSLVACVAADAVGVQHVVGVAMPSQYTSEESGSDAEELATALDFRFLTIAIEPATAAFSTMLEATFSGLDPDITEENLQARIRGNILMALSNKFGWLVLSTGNKSENSVGYATLYGDMAGGFAVIKDIPKGLVYDLCRYRNTLGEVIPARVLTKAPTAELRPDQKDTDTLPPYDTLDPILQAYVEQDWDVTKIIKAGFDAATVERVVRMVDVAEYKRRQAAPGVKITPRAFGKDRRLPITNHFCEQPAQA